MSSSAIDQILQIATPARLATEPLQTPGSDGPAFQDHLERAAGEVKPHRNTEREKEENTDLTSTASEQDAGTSQQDEGVVSSEIEEQPASETETEVDDTVEANTDDVVVSDAAATALADLTVVAEDEEVADAVVVVQTETSAEEANDGSEEPASPQAAALDEPVVEGDQTEKPAVLLETEVVVAPVIQTEKKSLGEKLSGDSVDNLKLYIPSEGEGSSDTETETTDQSVPSTAVKQFVPEEDSETQPQALKLETESQASDSGDEKSEKHESKPVQPATFSEKQAALSETPDLAPENQPNVVAAAPAGEAQTSAAPQPATPSSVVADLNAQPAGSETAATTEAPSEPEGTSAGDRARFVRRVGGAIRSAQSRDGKIQLQLRPSELGSLRIEITVKEGVVTARLEAETSAARTILLDNLPALRERLAEQEIRIEKFDVDVRDEGKPASDNPGAEDRQANGSDRESRGPRQNLRKQQEIETTTQDTNIHSVQIDSLDVSV